MWNWGNWHYFRNRIFGDKTLFMKQLFLFLCFISVCFQLKAQTPDEKLAIAERVIKETPEFKSFKEKNKKYEMSFKIVHQPVEKTTNKMVDVAVTAIDFVKKSNDEIGYKEKGIAVFNVDFETNKVILRKSKGDYKLKNAPITLAPLKK